MIIKKVLISESCANSLEKRQLIKAYQKAKSNILEGHFDSVNFKKRRPYKSEKYYFRINKQYRAFCFFEGPETIKVFEINDHQN